MEGWAAPCFVVLPFSENDTAPVQVVGRKGDLHIVARHDSDVVLAHLSRQMGKDDVLVLSIGDTVGESSWEVIEITEDHVLFKAGEATKRIKR